VSKTASKVEEVGCISCFVGSFFQQGNRIENQKNNVMSTDKKTDNSTLITIAIHTYEKAQVLQTILQTHGVDAVLQNVNQIQPVVSSGVRVRIKESDLPRALAILEDHQWTAQLKEEEKENNREKSFVLIPIDFSPATDNVVRVGLKFALRRNLQVMLLHSVFTPYFGNIAVDVGDLGILPIRQQQVIREELTKANNKMKALVDKIRKEQSDNLLPLVPVEGIIREGTPDEVILSYAKRHTPVAIVMGTRGWSKNEEDLIGSVAAEVIDSAKVPVLVVPEDVIVTDLADLTQVGVATGFDQRDLVLFDRMIQLMLPNHPHYCIFNISRGKESTGELHLRIISDYHKKHYPDEEIEFSELDKGDFSEALDAFVKEKQIQMIVVNTYRRNLLAKFFNPSMARRMLFHAGTPLLVMHSNESSH
jgi:nucleotide-binding universal stress UspA family protein